MTISIGVYALIEMYTFSNKQIYWLMKLINHEINLRVHDVTNLRYGRTWEFKYCLWNNAF